MTKKTRLIILLVCVLCFLVIAPVLVFYSIGYRFDFEKMQVTETGGIYVKTSPAAEKIIIDSKITEKPGMFSNWIFVQSLLPSSHTVLIKKNGYYDYFKTLPVQEEQVTKLENVLLIKKSLAFSDVADKVDYFSVAPNNQSIITSSSGAKSVGFNYFSLNNPGSPQTFSISQPGKILDVKWSDDSSSALIGIQNSSNIFYYLFNNAPATQTTTQKPTAIRLSYLDKNSRQISFKPQDPKTLFYIENKTLYSAKGNNSLPIINNVVSFKASGTNIIWLSSKGALYNSDLSGKLITAITLKNFPADSQKTYEIIIISQNTFLKENNSLFLLNQNTKTFENFKVPVTDYKILASPDNKNLIFWNSSEIYVHSFTGKNFEKIFSVSQITDCKWLNNDYVVLTAGNKITISEIDYRGNINAVTLPQIIAIPPNKITIKNPEIFFNKQNNKLYILTNNTLVSSEKIIP